MPRYLMTTAIAEIIGILGLWFSIGVLKCGVHQEIAGCAIANCFASSSLAVLNGPFPALHNQALSLASQLDFMDCALTFLIGFPATAVFAIWTFDRRRMQKQSA